MTYPRISIITPSFNQGQYIEHTLRSVIEQDYPNLEYIIIDGSSTDNTKDILKKYENKLTYWVSEPDKGQAHAINKGLKRCTGDIIGWLNSDDLLVPNALFAIASHFPTLAEPALLSGQGRFFNEQGVVWEPSVCDGNLTRTHYNKAMLLRCWKYSLHQPSTFWNKALMEQIGYINEDLFFAMDLDYWLRIIDAGIPVYTYQKVLSEFRLHESSKTVAESARLKKDLSTLAKKHLSGATALYYNIHKYINYSTYKPARQIIRRKSDSIQINKWFNAVIHFPLSLFFAPRLMLVAFIYSMGGRKFINRFKKVIKL